MVHTHVIPALKKLKQIQSQPGLHNKYQASNLDNKALFQTLHQEILNWGFCYDLFEEKVRREEARETAQLYKSAVQVHAMFKSPNPDKKWGMAAHTCNPNTGMGTDTQIAGVGFSERPRYLRRGWGVTEQDASVFLGLLVNRAHTTHTHSLRY